MNDLINGETLQFAACLAKEFARKAYRYCDTSDFESLAFAALFDSSTRYCVTRSATFRTFAYLRIRGALLDEMRRQAKRGHREIVGVYENIEEVQRSVIDSTSCNQPDEMLSLRERAEYIRRSVRSLRCDKERTVLEMIYFAEYSPTEVAHTLGRSKSWVSRYHRNGLCSLSECVQQLQQI